MRIHRDFEEFLRLLIDEHVEFVIVGGYAVAFHGYVRATNDLDLFFSATVENVQRIRRSLERFGLPTAEQQVAEFMDPGSIIRMGLPPVRIEMINRVSGIDWRHVWQGRVAGTYGKVGVSFISLPDLLVNKRAAGRPKDLADVDELGGEAGQQCVGGDSKTS